MLGRVLFAVVCVIIATGLLLPVYPTEVAMPGTADARDMLVAGTKASACGDCDLAAASGRVACERALQPTARTDCLHLTVYLIIRPLPVEQPPGEPQLLRPRIPTI